MRTSPLALLLALLLPSLDLGNVWAQVPPPELSPVAEATDTDTITETGAIFGDFFTVSVTACTLDEKLLTTQDTKALAEQGIYTAQMVSQERMPHPSLWWASEQLLGDRQTLVEDWFILPDEKRIELIVNRFQWSQLDSLEQYRIVNHFGAVARDAGYQLRIFNRLPKCLAIYACETEADALQCEIDMQPSRRDPFGFF
ncbi:hypothetical protein [Spirulina major]|uniref:hypothetical protein n=1 Tax=Spirulina major TaxID=270636 RepID=UPI000934A621|nr:hypothetical protein [Spirulina major]